MLSQGRMHFQAQLVVCDNYSKIQYFENCWTKGQMFLSRCYFSLLLHGFLPHGSLIHQSMQAKKAIERICQQDESHNLMYFNHGSDIPLPLPCSIDQKQNTSPIHTQGEGITKGQNTRSWGSLGTMQGTKSDSRHLFFLFYFMSIHLFLK